MTTISDYDKLRFYGDDERELFSVQADLELDTHRTNLDQYGSKAIRRLREAIDREAQAMQDELDEDGEIEEVEG